MGQAGWGKAQIKQMLQLKIADRLRVTLGMMALTCGSCVVQKNRQETKHFLFLKAFNYSKQKSVTFNWSKMFKQKGSRLKNSSNSFFNHFIISHCLVPHHYFLHLLEFPKKTQQWSQFAMTPFQARVLSNSYICANSLMYQFLSFCLLVFWHSSFLAFVLILLTM